MSFIADGVNGHLVPERSPQAYARCLDIVMSEGPEMAEAARRTAARMGWDSVADGLVAHYASMIEDRGRVASAGGAAAVMVR